MSKYIFVGVFSRIRLALTAFGTHSPPETISLSDTPLSGLYRNNAIVVYGPKGDTENPGAISPRLRTTIRQNHDGQRYGWETEDHS